jgi:plastocyanin
VIRPVICWLSLCLLCALAPVVNAATSIVNVGGAGLVFSPQTITIDPGDTVVFINKGGFHNVVADDGSFRCARGCDGDGNNGSGNASTSNWIASVVFDTPGTIGYFCEIHGMPGGGMFGTIIVNGPVTPPPPPPSSVDGIPALSSGLLALLICAIVAEAFMTLAAVRRRGDRSR